MKKETLEEMRQFELFVEKMESFVDNIELDGYPIEQYDLRAPSLDLPNNNIYSIPHTIKEYAEIWEDVKNVRNNMTPYYEKCVGRCVFFDVYWNSTEENRADYTGETLWVDFEENGEYNFK